MKWLILTPFFLPEKLGGNFIYADLLAKNLINKGHEVHILTTTKKEYPKFENKKNLYIHRVKINYGNMGPLFFNYTKKITNFFIELDKKYCFDIINIQSAFLIDYKKIRNDIIKIQTLHAVVTYEYIYRTFKFLILKPSFKSIKDILIFPILLPISWIREYFSLKNSNYIVLMSKYMKKVLIKFFPFINQKKIFISKIGIDTQFLRKSKKIKKNFISQKEIIKILTVRRLEPRMGIDNLIRAIYILKKNFKINNINLNIVGKGSLKPELRKLIYDLELEKNVFLKGFMSKKNLIDIHYKSHIFVMPTLELEGFGIASIQAASTGLPVVSTNAGANKEVIGKYFPDLICNDSKNYYLLAKKIHKCIREYKNINIAKIKNKIVNEYLWDEILNNLIKKVI